MCGTHVPAQIEWHALRMCQDERCHGLRTRMCINVDKRSQESETCMCNE